MLKYANKIAEKPVTSGQYNPAKYSGVPFVSMVSRELSGDHVEGVKRRLFGMKATGLTFS